MSSAWIYECLCDETRLRIVQFLLEGPLCVCHLQEALGISQARVSQHLAYLRKRGMVESRRRGTWMIYSLPKTPGPDLKKHLALLKDCSLTDEKFHAALKKLRLMSAGCGPAENGTPTKA